MEVGTKLFPAIFVEATSKEVLQFELGRTPTTLPLSAAVLQNSEKHVVPQVSSTFFLLLFLSKILIFSFKSVVPPSFESANTETSSMVASPKRIFEGKLVKLRCPRYLRCRRCRITSPVDSSGNLC